MPTVAGAIEDEGAADRAYRSVTELADAVDVATAELVTNHAGSVRDAHLLSHGTTEQLCLLLRVALARHLASVDETAPLVLDDITAQSDVARTRAVLDLLHRISQERQVVLFTQEDEVAAWAEDSLGERDRYSRLQQRRDRTLPAAAVCRDFNVCSDRPSWR